MNLSIPKSNPTYSHIDFYDATKRGITPPGYSSNLRKDERKTGKKSGISPKGVVALAIASKPIATALNAKKGVYSLTETTRPLLAENESFIPESYELRRTLKFTDLTQAALGRGYTNIHIFDNRVSSFRNRSGASTDIYLGTRPTAPNGPIPYGESLL